VNFFEHQDHARKATTRLVVLFCLAVTLLIATLYFCLAPVFGTHHQVLSSLDGVTGGLSGGGPPDALRLVIWDPGVLFGVSIAVLSMVALGSLYKTLALAGGGSKVAEALGGVNLLDLPPDPRYAMLGNVVEEMAIASGVAVPSIYVLLGEPGINAFAAGWSTDDAAVAVTEGALDQLSRDELQGVIGHEFSHILNGDMRLNIRLIGVLHGILLIGLVGQMIIRGVSYGGRRRSNSKEGGAVIAILLFGVLLLVVGYVGFWMGQLIKAGISRQREFLADACAVQFTRSTDGLAGALTKIGGFADGSSVASSRAEEASHMFFGRIGLKASWFNFMSTHPPLEERIARLDLGAAALLAQMEGTPSAAAQPVPGMEGISAMASGPGPDGARIGIRPEQVVDQVGTIDDEHLAHSAALLAAFPGPARAAAHEPFGAVAILYGLLLDRDPAKRHDQLEMLARRLSEPLLQETTRLLETLDGMDPSLRLPLADVMLPTLRCLSDAQIAKVQDVMGVLAEADGKIDLFEFVLERLFRRRLDARLGKAVRRQVQFKTLREVLPDAELCLAVLADAGHADKEMAAVAWTRSVAGLTRLAATAAPLPRWGLSDLDTALQRLALAAPAIKKQFLDASVHCVLEDGYLAIEEAELLRLFAHSLELPLPPLLVPRAA